MRDHSERIARRERIALLLIVLVAVAVRVVHFAQAYPGPAFHAHDWAQGDMAFFHEVALRIAGGDVLLDGDVHPHHDWMTDVASQWRVSHPEEAARSGSPGSMGAAADDRIWSRWLGGKRFYQEPLYAYGVAMLYRLTAPEVGIVFLVQMLLGVSTTVLLYLATRRVFGRTAAAFAAAFSTVTGSLLFYELALLRATSLVFFTTLLLWISVRAIQRGGTGEWAWTGVVAGLAMALKMTFAPIAAGLLIHAAFDRHRALSARRRNAAAFAAACALALAPIAVRNVLVGVPPWAVANGAMNFAMGNAAGAFVRTGTPTYSFAALGGILDRSGDGLAATVVETLRTYDRPLDWVLLLIRKFVAVWHWYEIPNNLNLAYAQLHAPVLRWLPVRFDFLAALAAVGVLAAGRRHFRAWPFAGMIIVTTVVLVLFAHNSRFRLPMLPPLLSFAGLALANGVAHARQRRWRPLLGGAVLA
ncbi:glycosyltransferase family 39 protein, partial [bacterium]|nr:glycosyltransferase family 39 protein [bacterium]